MSENRCHCKAARTLIEMTNRWGRERGVCVCMHVCVCVSVCVCVCVCVQKSVRERKKEANPDHDIKHSHMLFFMDYVDSPLA